MIVIPMVGLSKRFFNSGYTKPKYMLDLNGKTVFEHSLSSFSLYFKTEEFLFIVRSDFDTPEFVESMAISLGIVKFKVVTLDFDTRGQAESVALGLQKSNYEGSITIFNIDTFRPGFNYPEQLCEGYLEVFLGDGDNWSFVKPCPNSSNRAIETAEKLAISNLCCTGLYYFSSVSDFMYAFNEQISLPKEMWPKGELYVAPLYNFLIARGDVVKYNLVDRKDVVFCGVPSEYESLKISKYDS
ncbi:glycosyltransferase family 2 protein [Vibrio vulnificus]|nr:glycosyltransferase family 2 protein [Vibrio vulnificus]HAS8589937.1 capsular biosynthesis protein [Vibrio vulnificus]